MIINWQEGHDHEQPPATQPIASSAPRPRLWLSRADSRGQYQQPAGAPCAPLARHPEVALRAGLARVPCAAGRAPSVSDSPEILASLVLKLQGSELRHARSRQA